MSIGMRIRNLRRAKGIRQHELADMLSTTKQTISKYERGVVTNIPKERVEEMARILGTTPEYILGWEDSTGNPVPLSEAQKRLVEYVSTVPANKAQLVLQVIRLIVEAE